MSTRRGHPREGCLFSAMSSLEEIALKNDVFLRRFEFIRTFMTSTETATLVSAIALSRIYYCHSLLFGSTHDVTSHLQRIQNYAARVILRLSKSFGITTHLK